MVTFQPGSLAVTYHSAQLYEPTMILPIEEFSRLESLDFPDTSLAEQFAKYNSTATHQNVDFSNLEHAAKIGCGFLSPVQ